MKKEQLIEELAKIRQSHADWVSGDENRRKEFAKAFNWYDEKSIYDYKRELKFPTWPEIYVKIGKLLALRDFYDLEGNVSELEAKTENLEIKVNKLTQPQ